MFYIKLEDDMSLVVTAREPIYRGDNLNRKIRYLVPLKVGDIDMETAFVYLNYIRADGVADVVRLECADDKYNESYFQYILPVTCKLSKCAGQVCTWMQIYSGSVSNPAISKSGECILQIEDSKNMDDYLCDHQVTAIYQMQKQLEEEDPGSGDEDDSGETPDWEDMDENQEDASMPDWEDMDNIGGDSTESDSSWDEMS